MILTVLATELSEAVAKDEQEDGIDISAGLYCTHTSNWLRKVAKELSDEETQST